MVHGTIATGLQNAAEPYDAGSSLSAAARLW